jgi:hypothetical protein
MSDSTDSGQARTPEAAAAETEEPAEAARVRAEDDANTKARQEETAAGLREADRSLENGEARLRLTKAELRRREEELTRTSHLAREVAKNAKALQEQTHQIIEGARRATPDDVDR